jgi:hypothetical protein
LGEPRKHRRPAPVEGGDHGDRTPTLSKHDFLTGPHGLHGRRKLLVGVA